MRGKQITLLLLPFSFREFLYAKDIKLEINDIYSNKVFEIKKQFEEYFKLGGFPEVVITSEYISKKSLLGDYFNTILYKDIVGNYDLKDELVVVVLPYLLSF